MPSKTPLVLSILKRAAMTAGTMDVSAPASGMMAPVTNTTQPTPSVNQLSPVTPQHTATTAMPPNSADTQALKTTTTGPQTQNSGIAAAAQVAGKSSGRGGNQLGGTKGNPGAHQSSLNSVASRFSIQNVASEIPTRNAQPQEPSVDDTVRRKMQYRWKDKMQKIDQGMSKLELQREQAQAEMQLEEEQLRQNEQLKAEQKQFDEQVKAQKQQQQIAQQMPQNPLGAMQQQQGGMARQMYPQQKMAGVWGDIKTSVNDDKYFKTMGMDYNLKDKASRERYLKENPQEVASAVTAGPIGLIAYRATQLARRRRELESAQAKTSRLKS